MDKYDLVLELTAHPEKYTSRELSEILSDPEVREIYDIMCRTASAAEHGLREPDVEAEWESFADENFPHRGLAGFAGSRAASIGVVALSSLAAVAVGIAITVASFGHKEQALPETPDADAVPVAVADTTAPTADSRSATEPILFENRSVSDVMEAVSAHYGVTVRYARPATSALRLYYKFDPSLPLDEVIGQLSTFEQIDIRRDGETLTVL